MKANSLFKVLVLGGAALGAQASSAQEVLGTVQMPFSLAMTTEGALVFCNANDENTCEVNSEGRSVAKEGLVCCWGTSCAAE